MASDTDAVRSPLDDIVRERAKQLVLPPRSGAIAGANPGLLCQVFVDDPKLVDLKLLGVETVYPRGVGLELTVNDRAEQNQRVWEVSEVARIGVSSRNRIGQFVLHDQKLSFEWQTSARSGRLRYCVLEVSARSGGQTERASCVLTQPVPQGPLQLSFDRPKYRVPLGGDVHEWPSFDQLHMELFLRGLPASRWSSQRMPLILDAAAKERTAAPLTIDFLEGDSGDKLVSVEARLVGDETLDLLVENQAAPLQLVWDRGDTRETRDDPFTHTVSFQRAVPPLSLGRSSFGDVRKSAKQNATGMRALLRTRVQPLIAEAERIIAADARSPSYTSANRNLVTQARDQLRRANECQEAFEDAIEQLDSTDDSLAAIESLYTGIESQLTVEYSIYLDIDGVRVMILEGRSTPPSAGPPALAPRVPDSRPGGSTSSSSNNNPSAPESGISTP